MTQRTLPSFRAALAAAASMFTFTLRLLLLAGAAMLTACGGGDSDDPGPQLGPEVQSGQVAAGSHVENAVVFLDLNDNNVLDGNERRTTTDASGRYVLAGLYAADLAQHSIVVRIFPTATNAGTTTPAGLDCTLKAPPGQGAFVSPFTTLVASLRASTPTLTQAAAVEQVSAKLRSSQLALTAPTQLDFSRDYVLDSTATTATAGDSRKLRIVGTTLAGILTHVSAGLNGRQSFFDVNGSVTFNAMVTLAEAQLTQVANGSFQFEQLNAAQQGNLIANPGQYPNFFIDGNALLNGLISAIDLSQLGADFKDWVLNSPTAQQFFASLVVDLVAQVAELLFKILF